MSYRLKVAGCRLFAFALLCHCNASAATANLRLDYSEMVSTPASNVPVQLTCLSLLSGTSIIKPGPKYGTTDISGAVWFSNLVLASYQVTVRDTNGPITFRVAVTNTGDLHAGSIITTSKGTDTGSTAWSIAASDARYVVGLTNATRYTNASGLIYYDASEFGGGGGPAGALTNNDTRSVTLQSDLSVGGRMRLTNGFSLFDSSGEEELAINTDAGDVTFSASGNPALRMNAGTYSGDLLGRWNAEELTGNGSGLTNLDQSTLTNSHTMRGPLVIVPTNNTGGLNEPLLTLGGAGAKLNWYKVSGSIVTSNTGTPYVLNWDAGSGISLGPNFDTTTISISPSDGAITAASFIGDGSGLVNVPGASTAITNGDERRVTLNNGASITGGLVVTNFLTLNTTEGGGSGWTSLGLGNDYWRFDGYDQGQLELRNENIGTMAAFYDSPSAISILPGGGYVTNGAVLWQSAQIKFPDEFGSVFKLGTSTNGLEMLDDFDVPRLSYNNGGGTLRGDWTAESMTATGAFRGTFTGNGGGLTNLNVGSITNHNDVADLNGQATNLTVRSSGATQAFVVNTNKFVVNTNGFVGIGTNNPQTELHVVGAMLAQNGIFTLNGNAVRISGNPGSAIIWSSASGNIYFDNGSTKGIQLKNGGNIGILNSLEVQSAAWVSNGVTVPTVSGLTQTSSFAGYVFGRFIGDGSGLTNKWPYNTNSFSSRIAGITNGDFDVVMSNNVPFRIYSTNGSTLQTIVPL